MTKSLLVVGIFIAAGLSLAADDSGHYTAMEQPVVAIDSLRICSTVYSPLTMSTETYVCLPMMGHVRESFRPFMDSLSAGMIRADSSHPSLPNWRLFDLRGHGCSIQRGKEALKFESMPIEEFAKFPLDVQSALQGQKELTIIGASIGANTAAIITEEMPDVKRLILLSPAMNYKGLEPADAILAFQGKILLVASQKDEYSYNSVREMAALNPDHITLMIFEGDAHGTDIINDNPAAMQALISWMLMK